MTSPDWVEGPLTSAYTVSLGIRANMATKTHQTFQWSFSTQTVIIRNMSDGQQDPRADIAPIKQTSSSSSSLSPLEHPKPYSSSSLWNPSTTHQAGKFRDRFLTLTPLNQQHVTSSLPLISMTPPKQEAMSEIINQPQNQKRTDMQTSYPSHDDHLDNDLIVPTTKLRLRPQYRQSNTRGRRRSHNVASVQYQQGTKYSYLMQQIQRTGFTLKPRDQTYKRVYTHEENKVMYSDFSPFRKLPNINSPLSESTLDDNKDDRQSERQRKGSDTTDPHDHSQWTEQRYRQSERQRKGSDTTDPHDHSQWTEKRYNHKDKGLWSNPNLSRKNTLLDSVRDKNVQDDNSLYSNKQAVYLSRIMRENSTMPLPEDCSQKSGVQPDAASLHEKRYVKENYYQRSNQLQRFAQDELVLPGVYKSLMKRRKARYNYMKSMFAKAHKEDQLLQMTCTRCQQELVSKREYHNAHKKTGWRKQNEHGLFTADANSRIEENLRQLQRPRGLNRFSKLGPISRPNADQSGRSASIKTDTDDKSTRAPSLSGVEHHCPTEYQLNPWQQKDNENISAHFCDVLGKSTCKKCQEFYAKRFRVKVEETLSKSSDFQLRSPPPTPVDASICIPVQALQKVVIRIKDTQGSFSVAAVGVNEDATLGL